MPDAQSRTGPTRRADYRLFLPVTTRWMDNDVFGHVNNAHYYSFFDTAVCTVLVRHGILGVAGPAYIMMVAESGCRYHSEAAFPQTLSAGLRVVRLGRSSVRYGIGVFQDGAELAAADGFLVHVCVDAGSRRPAPLPDRWRSVLAQLEGD